MVPEGWYENTICNCCKIRWYMAAITCHSWKNELILVFRTYLAHWFDLVGTLGAYTPRRWWKLEELRFTLTILEVYVMGNPAQLGFCGWCKLSHVLPTPECYLFDRRTTLESYTLRKLWKLKRFWLILIIFEVHTTGNTAQLYFCGGYELSQVLRTLPCH